MRHIFSENLQNRSTVYATRCWRFTVTVTKSRVTKSRFLYHRAPAVCLICIAKVTKSRILQNRELQNRGQTVLSV